MLHKVSGKLYLDKLPELTVGLLEDFAEGLVWKEIVEKRRVGRSKINHHIRSLMLLTEIHTTAGLVAWALRKGVIK